MSMKRIAFIISAFAIVILTFSCFRLSGEHSEQIEAIQVKQTVPFDEYLGVNSIREKRKKMIADQFKVVKYHRIFGMDSFIFTGEEIITSKKKNWLTVDVNIEHDEYPNDLMGFNPSKGAGGFDFDNFLMRMKSEGLQSIPVLAKNLLYANVRDDKRINVWQIPWDEGGDPENPMDFKAYSSFLYQFTARYGKNKLEEEGGSIKATDLKLISSNIPKAGLDLVYAIEPGNEMNKNWITKRETATPKIMAAFLSAAIDGHMGLMGEGHGIRLADPSMKIVFPSPIDIEKDYILEVHEEIVKLRKDAEKYGYKVDPFENFVFTAHYYPVKGGSQKKASGGEYVENTDMERKSVDFIKTMKYHFKNAEVYLTETGYDKVTNKFSKTGTPVAPGDSIDADDISSISHSKHTVRLVLSNYASGYDKIFLFTLRDPLHVGQRGYRTKFATTGLIRKKGNKDYAWYAINTLNSRLKGYVFNSLVQENDVRIMKLTHPATGSTAYITWLGTNENKLLPEYALKIDQEFNRLKKVELKDKQPLGMESNLNVTNGNVVVGVSEFPSLIICEK